MPDRWESECHGVHAAARPYSSIVEVLFRTGAITHRLPEPTATLLAENLWAWPVEEGSRPVARKIERFLGGAATEPIDLDDLGERLALREALDVVMAGPHDSPALRELFDCVSSEPRPRR